VLATTSIERATSFFQQRIMPEMVARLSAKRATMFVDQATTLEMAGASRRSCASKKIKRAPSMI
jgi:hypothetical protein